jgi:branched-chain amino acid transport system substrate-binding protein
MRAAGIIESFAVAGDLSHGAPLPMNARSRFFSHTLVFGIAAAGVFSSSLAADIKLGAAEALSGAAGQYGQSIKNGLELAVDEINASGGVSGNKLALQVEDEQTKKEQAIDVFKKLIFQDRVLMLFGPTLSSSAQAADPVAQAAKIVVFGTSNTADGITSIGDYVFRNSVTEADVLPETLRVSIKHANVKKVAILYGNNDIFTKSGYDAFKKALEDLKIPVTTTETFSTGDVDFKAQLTKIKASNPDAIVLSALIAEGAPIMVQARQLGIDLPFIGGNGMNTVKIFDLAKEKSDNLWVGSPWAIGSQTKENQHFVVSYTQKYKAAPDQFAAQAFDAVHVAAQALAKIKLSGDLEANRKALRDALPGVTWTGATGAFKFKQAMDKAGKPAGYDAKQAAIVSVTKGGKYSIEQ